MTVAPALPRFHLPFNRWCSVRRLRAAIRRVTLNVNEDMNPQSLNQSIPLLTPGQQLLTVKVKAAGGVWEWLSTFALLVSAYFSWGSRVLPAFILVAAFLVFLLVYYHRAVTGKLSMSSEEIIYNMRWGHYQMKWDEVTKVEMDRQSLSISHKIVFMSADERKRLEVLAPQYWHGPMKQVLKNLLAEEMKKRQIPLERTGRASYIGSRSTEAT